MKKNFFFFLKFIAYVPSPPYKIQNKIQDLIFSAFLVGLYHTDQLFMSSKSGRLKFHLEAPPYKDFHYFVHVRKTRTIFLVAARKKGRRHVILWGRTYDR